MSDRWLEVAKYIAEKTHGVFEAKTEIYLNDENLNNILKKAMEEKHSNCKFKREDFAGDKEYFDKIFANIRTCKLRNDDNGYFKKINAGKWVLENNETGNKKPVYERINMYNEFREVWGYDRIKNITIEEYDNLSKDKNNCFRYALETGYSELGGISGHNHKIGIYEIANENSKNKGGGGQVFYGEKYAYVPKLGSSEKEAFDNIKSQLNEVVENSRLGNYLNIEGYDIWPGILSKIAFLYQDTENIKIIPVYREQELKWYIEEVMEKDTRGLDIYNMYQEIIKHHNGKNLKDAFEIGDKVWRHGQIKVNFDSVFVVFGKSEGSDSEDNKEKMIEGGYWEGFGAKNTVNKIKENDIIILSGGHHTVRSIGKCKKNKKNGSKLDVDWFEMDSFECKEGMRGYMSTIKTVADLDNRIRILLKAKETTPNISEFLPGLDNFLEKHKERIDNMKNQSNNEGNKNKSNLLNQILYGPPGTGKTYSIKKEVSEILGYEANIKELKKNGRLAFVTFHPSYGYEEFIQGIRPNLSSDNDDVKYELKDGVFKKLCEKARTDIDNFYFMIIDEINRGNVSKIFGELITLIEDDKREYADNELSVKLPYSNEGDEEFSVPKNVFIIGTMNTADKSLVSLDIALRRRFIFKEMMPEYHVVDDKTKEIIFNKDSNESIMLKKINERIIKEIDQNHQIGHAFFIKNTVEEALEYNIIPLLQEYFYDDWKKVSNVLFDDENKIEKIRGEYESNENNEKTFFGMIVEKVTEVYEIVMNNIEVDNKSSVKKLTLDEACKDENITNREILNVSIENYLLEGSNTRQVMVNIMNYFYYNEKYKTAFMEFINRDEYPWISKINQSEYKSSADPKKIQDELYFDRRGSNSEHMGRLRILCKYLKIEEKVSVTLK